MTDEPYLILHKVRGLPAFDIAIKIMIGDEEGWIIPTSGHRAYPYFDQRLNQIIQEDLHDPQLPENWPDHYPLKPSPDSPSITASSLLKGLIPVVTRRI